MAFDSAGFRALGPIAGGRMVYTYATNDLITEADDSGYFNSVTSMLKKGDIILVSGDLDGTPANVMLTVNSATGAATVTTVAQASATLVLSQPNTLTVFIPVIGTAYTAYVDASVPAGYTGVISAVSGVSAANGAGSGGTSTITVSVPTTGPVATLPFTQSYVAGTRVEDSSITEHTLAAGAIITVATDGTGSHAGDANVTLVVTLTKV